MSLRAPTYTELLQYSFLALPLAFAGLPLYIHAPDFYTRDLGMNIGLIGVVLLGIRIFDAVQDPFIGYVSDKNSSSRFQIILAGVVMLVTGMAALFYGPQFSMSISVWFGASMILATTGFSIVTINLNMIGGFWQDSPRERTRISAWRESFGLLGLLLASVLPAALLMAVSAENSFQIVFWVFAALMICALTLFARFMRGTLNPQTLTKAKTQKGFSFFSILIGPDKLFFAVCFLAHLAAALPGVLVLFFIRDYLGASHLSGLFLLIYFVSGAAFMPIWVRLSAHIGKYKAWLFSMLLAGATFIWVYTLETGDTLAYGLICGLSGMALGADLALPPSIMADRINKQKTENEATQYYAVLAFIPKMAIALASGGSFIILDELGFIPGVPNEASSLNGLIGLYALLPCLIKLVAAGLLWITIKQEGENDDYIERSASHEPTNVS
jgi:GPH family glycoside/pentoside/hexuronide:cation symporter